MSKSVSEPMDYPAALQDSGLRGSPRLVFPARISWSLDRERPTKQDLQRVCDQVVHLATPWLAALVDRATRFRPTGPAFAHITFARELQSYNTGEDSTRILVAHAAVLSRHEFIRDYYHPEKRHLAMIATPPSANCFGAAITGLGSWCCNMRVNTPEPLCTVRRRLRNKWPQATSLLLTGSWSVPAAKIGPWLRDEVIPDMGLTHLRWWEYSDEFPTGKALECDGDHEPPA
jgi:hypothetical protein